MQARLIYNPNSGLGSKPDAEELQDAIREAGYEPVYKETSSEEELDPILQKPEGLLIAAGGDGTARAVATRLIGKGVPMAIIPLGTANNIATELGIQGNPRELIAGLARPKKHPFDIGKVRGPWGEDYFLEAAGLGFYACALESYEPENGKSLLRSLTTFADTISNFKAAWDYIRLDGKDISGDYFMVEAMNTPAFGPRLRLAPDALTNDGRLDIIMVQRDVRENFFGYLTEMLTDGEVELPAVTHKHGTKLEFGWYGDPVHVDAEVRPQKEKRPPDFQPAEGGRVSDEGENDKLVTVEILPGAVEIWLPESAQPPGTAEED